MKQVRGPPAARWLDSIKQWPQEVLKVGVCGSPHPGNSLQPMPALSLCVSLSTPPPPLFSSSSRSHSLVPLPFLLFSPLLSSYPFITCSKVRLRNLGLRSDWDIT